jgi:hypothetical protein
MSYLLRTTRYNLKTKEETVISEKLMEGEDRSEELLIQFFAEACLQDFRKDKTSNKSCLSDQVV